jgi:hypothetical protein
MSYLLFCLIGSVFLLGIAAILPERHWELVYKLF